MLAGCIHFDPHVVHAGNDGIIERVLEQSLLHIVLVLPNADGFRINLHQLCQWIHEATPDGNGTSHREIMRWKFLPRSLGGGIDRGAGFIHHNNRHLRSDLAHERLCFTPGSSIADSDRFDLVLGNEIEKGACRLHHLNLPRGGVDDIVVNQRPLGGQNHNLAAAAEAGIDGQHALLTKGGSEHQIL